MHKPLALAFIACIGLSGCGAFTTSHTWQSVTKVRHDSTDRDEEASKAYAVKLHKELKVDSVEHKVVTYQYHYTTALREEMVGTRTAVLYRDNTDRNNPWWLMEDRLARPVWVPGDDLQRQVAFYLHGSADVLNQKDFPAGAGDDKTTVANATPSNGSDHSGASRLARFRTKPSPNYYELTAVLPDSAAQEDSRIALFRSIHGTTYDPSSPLDRKKMALLQSASSEHPHPLAARTF